MERTKKRVHLWKKAIVHFSLCFVMGFFTGFFPTSKSSIFSHYNHVVASNKPEVPPVHPPVETFQRANTSRAGETPLEAALPEAMPQLEHLQRVKLSEEAGEEQQEERRKEEQKLDSTPRKLVIIVTPTSTKDKFSQGVLLRRLANTIGLVPPPLLWIVVEGQTESDEVSRILRKTGIMYRHLVFKENFTDTEAELDHQRNVALKHIEHHRLSGIVHFAGLSNVYDLEFFNELRKIEAFGTWPVALLAAKRNKVTIEGPVCDYSQVIGWHLRKMNNETEDSKPPINISSFGFNSSILWDPERWGRTSSFQSTSQSSIKFVKQVVLEDETEIQGIPPNGCSKIMLWHLHLPTQTTPRNPPPLPSSVDGSNQR